MTSADLDFCHFLPWVGPEYESPAVGGLRVLILGESHYTWPGMDPTKERETTRMVVQDELDGTSRHPFLSRMAGVVLGPTRSRSYSEAAEVWKSVAFYNYVQEFVGSRPRIRPNRGAWQRAQAYLPRVLDVLRPDLVVACGRQLYEQIKTIPDLSSDGVFGRDQLTRSRSLHFGSDGRAVMGLVYHPASWGFRTAAWHRRFLEYADRASKAKYVPPTASSL